MEDVIVILSDEELVDTFTDDIFKQYMNEIKKYPLLSKEETLDLFRRYQSGDFKTREELINSNLRLVVNVANHYRGVINHLHILDIIQEGNLGLMRAVETYDPEQGAFSTYAFPWIRQRITRSLSNSEATIRKPVHMDSLIRKYKRLMDKNPDLSDAEIMDDLDIDAVNLKIIRDTISNTVVSMN
ncbi:MAG: sigma-70 family RNA polymerase sigma factor [Candidatus Coprovivens sp.]